MVIPVPSDSNPEQQYEVDLDQGTCTCPQYVHKLVGTGRECKHFAKARQLLSQMSDQGRQEDKGGRPPWSG